MQEATTTTAQFPIHRAFGDVSWGIPREGAQRRWAEAIEAADAARRRARRDAVRGRAPAKEMGVPFPGRFPIDPDMVHSIPEGNPGAILSK